MPATIDVPIESTASIQFPGLTGLQKAVSGSAQREQLLNRWADDYFASIHARHNTMSSGAGDWPPLSPATIAKRKQRLKSQNPSVVKPFGLTTILKDTLQLLNATRKKGGPGQIRRLDTKNFTLTVGIGGGVYYRDPVSPRRRTKKLLGTLAGIHARKRRRIIVPPNKQTVDKMQMQAQIWILKRVKGK